MDAAQLAHQQAAAAPLPDHPVNKWEVLRELGAARHLLGVTDRELVVLQALLSFHPGTDLGAEASLIVFPSNAAICERLNGMPCSTMRRHLGGLVRAGLLRRRDSPNGKRFARGSGEAFGFDLSPLPRRFAEICRLAEETRAQDEAYARLRRTVSLMRRDLAGLASYGAETQPMPLWDRFSDLAALTARDLRRKLSVEDLEALQARLLEALDAARDLLERHSEDMSQDVKMNKLSTNESRIEHHIQNSNTDSHESELRLERQNEEVDGQPSEDDLGEADRNLPRVPLVLVLKACPKLQDYIPDKIRHWHHLVSAAETIRPMMGISPSAWTEATRAMGPEQASVVLAAMLERFSDLRSPGGYLRALTAKSAANAFSCGPMIMALVRRDDG